jgi:hypothetical protein
MLNYVTRHQPVHLNDMCDLFATEVVTKVKPNINSVEVHSQLSNNWHPADWCAGSLWPQYSDTNGKLELEWRQPNPPVKNC